ncbi:MAG: glycosyltransferase, partial [Thermodesulfovibrionales bacterium]|nr:glycosyltransferase [Thermodesulfovibrionales bacterium]
MKKSVIPSRRAIIVLGMHRSGTSALARTLNLCGVDLGSNLMPPGPEDNVKGFWEHLDIFQANEKLLRGLNSSWDDVRALPDRWWTSDFAGAYKLEIISILERDFSNSPLWGVKDPRICRFLPLWRPILEQTDNKPLFLIIVRNPLEVVASLAKRDGFSKGKSCLLWLKHLIESEKGTRNASRVFVTYEELLSDWKGVLSYIKKTFNFKWPIAFKKAAPQIEAFLSSSLRHNEINDDILIEDQNLSKWISHAYLAAKKAVEGDDGHLIKIMDAIGAALREVETLYEPAITDLKDKHQSAIVQLHQLEAERDEVIGGLRTQLGERDEHIQEQARQIEHQNGVIQEQTQEILTKNTHICNIESQLNLIKGSKVWRIAEFFRRLVYQKLLGRFPLVQRGVLILSTEGFRAFYVKSKRKLRDYYSTNKHTPEKNYRRRSGLYEVYIENNKIYPHVRRLLTDASTQFEYRPLISIIMPVYNVEPRWLKAAVKSIIQQIYTNWELCIADDASTNKKTLEFLKCYENHENIKIVFRTKNGHICAASNSAADQAKGEFVAFMDNDDVLAPNALFEIVRILQDHPDTDLIYSDEDKIDENDKRYDPQFKPDWSPELFLSYNYVNHFTCIRRKLFETVGRFRTGYEGAQDYDLILRVIEKTNKIRHISKVLYHWRAIKGSVAFEAADKPIMHTSARRGLKEHLKRKGIEAGIYQPEFAKSMGLPISQLDWSDDGLSVAIIIPTKNQYKLLKKCIESIIKLTTYSNYEIVVVDNDSDQGDTLDYLKDLVDKGIRTERIGNDGGPFSFSRINNLAVQRVNTEYILFLNNDIEVLEPKWLSRLVGYLSIPGVGVTGARLFYPNKTIQHAGVVLGMHDGIIPDNAFLNHHYSNISYYFMAEVARNCSAVTGACLMTRRSDFIRSGGFNEQDFKVSLQDVDYCLRLAKEGLRTVYVAGAKLIHHESMSRNLEDDPRELARLRKTYVLNDDPYYNPNLSKINSFAPDAGSGAVDYERFLKIPLKVVIFTHNLELAGAPKAMYDLAVGLQKQSAGKIIPKIISPVRGPFQSLYDLAGIECQVIDQNLHNIDEGWKTRIHYDSTIEKVQEFLEAEKPDVLITNTVYGFYFVHVGQHLDIPVIWIISESFDQFE